MPYRNAIVGLLSASTLVLLGACSDDDKATPQVIFDGTITLGSHTSTECGGDGDSFSLGDFGNLAATPPTGSAPVKDGDTFEGAKASVACSVTSAGNETFNVSGTLDLAGSAGGVFRIDGQFKTTGQQTGIHAFFSSRKTANVYDETDRQCTVDFTTAYQGVAAGRVWGELTCPNAVNSNADRTCAIKASFRFENCAQ